MSKTDYVSTLEHITYFILFLERVNIININVVTQIWSRRFNWIGIVQDGYTIRTSLILIFFIYYLHYIMVVVCFHCFYFYYLFVIFTSTISITFVHYLVVCWVIGGNLLGFCSMYTVLLLSQKNKWFQIFSILQPWYHPVWAALRSGLKGGIAKLTSAMITT